MKEVQNKNHTDEAKRLNEELDQNLKDLQPESKEAFQGFEVKEEKNEKKKKAKKKSDLDSAGRAGAWSGGDFWAVSGAETGNFRK